MSEDEIDSLIYVTGWDMYEPLRDFADLYGLNSLHNLVDDAQKEWLSTATNESDWTTMPDHYVDFEEERALLNEGGEVIVNDTIYKMLEEGVLFIIPEANFDMLDEVNNNLDSYKHNNPGTYVTLFGTVIVRVPGNWGSGGGGTQIDYDKCGGNVEKGFVGNGSKYRIHYKTKLGESVLGQRRVVVHTKGFRKRWLGGWWTTRSNVYVRIYGHLYNSACENESPIDMNNQDSNGYSARRVYNLPGGGNTKYHKLTSEHNGVKNGVTISFVNQLEIF